MRANANKLDAMLVLMFDYVYRCARGGGGRVLHCRRRRRRAARRGPHQLFDSLLAAFETSLLHVQVQVRSSCSSTAAPSRPRTRTASCRSCSRRCAASSCTPRCASRPPPTSRLRRAGALPAPRGGARRRGPAPALGVGVPAGAAGAAGGATRRARRAAARRLLLGRAGAAVRALLQASAAELQRGGGLHADAHAAATGAARRAAQPAQVQNVVAEFEKLQLCECAHIIAANERTAVGSHNVGGGASRLDDFFPFDPLLLKLVGARPPLYKTWEPPTTTCARATARRSRPRRWAPLSSRCRSSGDLDSLMRQRLKEQAHSPTWPR